MNVDSIRKFSWLTVMLCIMLFYGCATKAPITRLAPEMPPQKMLSEAQEMLALSLISYTGELLKGSDDHVETLLGPCIEQQLEYQPLTKNQWQLVWGPAVYKFELGQLDDNMMYVVQNKQKSNEYAIVIRGTNGMAILDWLKEDLDVAHTNPWPYGKPDPTLSPQISASTLLGLNILRKLKPASGLLGANLTIDQYLKQVTARPDENIKIHVTGHSLAGALSPTLTLWLADTQNEWDPESKASLDVYAFAGPTAGNADFAQYSDSRIGFRTHRIYNPYDIVPKAWNIASLNEIPKLYSPDVKFPFLLRIVLYFFKHKIDDINYTQIAQNTPPIPGVLNTSKTKFASQAGWQHVCGYQCGLKIRDSFYETPAKCEAPSGKLACDVCPN